MKKTNTISIGGIKILIGRESYAEIGNELRSKNSKKVMIVTDPGIEKTGLLDYVTKPIEEAGFAYVIYDQVQTDPGSAIVRNGVRIFKENDCDTLVAIGGGSTIDAAKAINLMTTNEGDILDYMHGKKFVHEGHCLMSIPTTSGTGSEVTQYAVITDEEQGIKSGVGDPMLTSKVVFLSPYMTIGLPPKITAATGIDALTHGIEAYTTNRVLNAEGSTLISDTLALKGIEVIAENLAKVYWNPEDIDGRLNMMLGCTLTGLVTQAGSGSAHGIGAALGARYHVPHGNSVGVVLPEVMEANIYACPQRFKDIALAMGRNVDHLNLIDAAKEAVIAVRDLLRALNFPKLKDYIPDIDDVIAFVPEAMRDHCNDLNAHILTEEEMHKVLVKAWQA